MHWAYFGNVMGILWGCTGDTVGMLYVALEMNWECFVDALFGNVHWGCFGDALGMH